MSVIGIEFPIVSSASSVVISSYVFGMAHQRRYIAGRTNTGGAVPWTAR